MARPVLRAALLGATALAISWLAQVPALADAASDAAFQEVLKDPGNLEKNLTYANALVKSGDLEGAVAVLERLVLLFPERAELHLTLGKLYQRLNSDAAAAQAFDSAIAAPVTTPQIKQEAEELRARALKRTANSQLSGSIYAGMQYQTNATAGPDSHHVWSDGALVDRPHHGGPDDDFSGIFGFGLSHKWDFGLQDGMALESRISGFGQLYDENSRLDTGRIAGQVGLGFAPFPQTTSALRLTPRVNFEAATTDGEFLEGGGGPGLGVTYAFSDTLGLEFGYDAIYRHYGHISALGSTEQYSGFEQNGIITVTWLAAPGTTLVASIGGRDADTRRDFLDYTGAQGSLGLYQTYGSPIAALPQDWLVGLSAGYEHRWYDSPDDSLNPDRSRHDSIWQFDAVNTIPLSASWSLSQQVEYLMDDSNLRNYSYDNFTVALSARWQF
ncbi:MAG TPA: tetratricopeptide repeat protein [Dongiaceae bacterium]|nr:tetratricopeptide repeat protein [Dongiaceae bacterium]